MLDRQDVVPVTPAYANLTDLSGAIKKGVTGHGSITGGDSGTDGTFALGFTGGTGTAAVGTFTVASGALTAITITSAGDYSVAPTDFDFSASANLANAAASVTTATHAKTIAAANPTRHGFKICNTSAGTLYYNDTGGTASAGGAGSYSIAAGDTYETPLSGASRDALSIYGATLGQAYSAAEW